MVWPIWVLICSNFVIPWSQCVQPYNALRGCVLLLFLFNSNTSRMEHWPNILTQCSLSRSYSSETLCDQIHRSPTQLTAGDMSIMTKAGAAATVFAAYFWNKCITKQFLLQILQLSPQQSVSWMALSSNQRMTVFCQNKSSFSFKSISYDHWLVVIDVELWRRQIKRMDARTAQKYETRESSLCFHETAIRGFYSDFRLNWTRRRAKRGKEGRGADLTLDSGTC